MANGLTDGQTEQSADHHTVDRTDRERIEGEERKQTDRTSHCIGWPGIVLSVELHQCENYK